MKEEHLQVKRRHGPTAFEQIKWHLGTLVAVFLAILLGLQCFGLFAGPPAAATGASADLERTMTRVKAAVGARSFPVDERIKAVVEQVGSVRTSLKHSGTPVEAGEGLTYPPSYLKTLKPGESNEIRFQAPIELVATAEAGGIALQWAEAANNNVKIGSFEVFRKEGGGEPAKVQSVEGTAHVCRDATVQPGHSYEYTVQAVAADPDIANTPRGRSAPSAPATAKAIADFKLDLIEQKDGVATIKVSKWHGGAWRDRTFDVREGEAIGQMDPALGVDFSTGRKLVKISVETSEMPITRDELVFDPKGRVVVEQGIPKRVSVSGVETRKRTKASISGGELPDDTIEVAQD